MHITLSLKSQIIKELINWLIVLGIFAVLFFCDISCQWENLRLASLGGWYYILSNSGIYALVITGIVMLLGHYGVFFAIPAYCYLFLVALTSVVLRFGFGMTLNKELFFIIRASSKSEAMAFFSMLCSFLNILMFIVIMSIAVLGGWWLIRTIRHHKIAIRWRYLIGAFCVIAFLGYNHIWRGTDLITCKVRSLRLWQDYAKCKQRITAMLNMTAHPVLPEKLVSIIPEEKNPLLVFVIGESATRNFMSLYGYQQNTTPCMDNIKDELIIWNDVLAAWPRTTEALGFLLTQATREDPLNYQCSLTDVFKAVGYRTVYFSEGAQWGDSEGDIAKFFYNADKKESLHDRLTRKFYDGDLMLLLNEELETQKDDPKPTVIFLHLLGSHFPPERCYPETWRPFPGGSMIGDYINSIAFTDKLLGEVYETLEKTGRPSMMFYISDHGESPAAKHWRDLSSLDTWEIPMFLWMSPDYKLLMQNTAVP